MIEIDDKIVSLDLFEKNFCCNLARCKGQCCIEGDSGAPLESKEKEELEKVYSKIKKYLSEEAIAIIDKQGVSYVDVEGDLVTSIIGDKQCVFTYFDEAGICKCAVEKAFLDGEISFRKPISCYLYPVRVKEYKRFVGVNYDQWDICSDACVLGDSLKLPVYVFLKEPLIAKFGEKWYEKLCIAADHLQRTNPKKDQ